MPITAIEDSYIAADLVEQPQLVNSASFCYHFLLGTNFCCSEQNQSHQIQEYST